MIFNNNQAVCSSIQQILCYMGLDLYVEVALYLVHAKVRYFMANFSTHKSFDRYILNVFGCGCLYDRKTGVRMRPTSRSLMRTLSMMNGSRSLMWKTRTKKFKKQKVSCFLYSILFSVWLLVFL